MRTGSDMSLVLNNLGAILRQRKDVRWLLFWLVGMVVIWIWDALFLDPLSYELLQAAIFNTLFGAGAAVVFALTLGWGMALLLYFLESGKGKIFFLPILFLLNLIRSIPQIIGLLIGYIALSFWMENGLLQFSVMQIFWMACVIGIFCSLEIIDLVGERIAYFKKSDYFYAMQCCGMKESRIINMEILWKSSSAHLVHKSVSLFGNSIFLQCSIGFIVSVGLSNEVSLTNFPVTLGSLLAKLDSKQDILAVGYVFVNLSYLSHLFFQHLQGVSVAALIVFTLLCIYHIADGLIHSYDL
jgi:ABC-type methionine transport system permease subunit